MSAVVRNPLSVPVSEATPEELEIQARYHATNASYNCLDMFTKKNNQQASDTFRLIGTPAVTTRIDQQGESIVDTIQALWLCDLPDGSTLVVFRSNVLDGSDVFPGGCAFGVLDPDHNILREYTLENICLLTDTNTIRSAARTLNERTLEAGLQAAAERIAQQR